MQGIVLEVATPTIVVRDALVRAGFNPDQGWQIFLKMFALKRAAAKTDAFEDEFWKGGDLNALFQRSSPAT